MGDAVVCSIVNSGGDSAVCGLHAQQEPFDFVVCCFSAFSSFHDAVFPNVVLAFLLWIHVNASAKERYGNHDALATIHYGCNFFRRNFLQSHANSGWLAASFRSLPLSIVSDTKQLMVKFEKVPSSNQ